MIRVLVVDDDKLVRRGIVSSMPWQDFGMVVAGEANNGENALKFMEANEVDLLMTDLSMPVMSGIELMRIVRSRYPHVQIVVLTLHQDFEYIQEALRIGAIDYIAKYQLEREQFEEVLGRIVTLLGRRGTSQAPSGPQQEWAGTDVLYVCYELEAASDGSVAAIRLPAHAAEAEAGVWYWPESGGAETYRPQPNAALIRYTGLSGMDRGAVMQLIRAYRKNDLFYEYDPARPVLELNAQEWSSRAGTEAATASADSIKAQWGSADWIHDDAVFERLLRELASLRLPPIRLTRIFFTITDELNRMYRQMLAEPLTIDDFFPAWCRFASWIGDVRERIRLANSRSVLSEEIQNSIVKAMQIVEQRLDEPVSAGEIAQMVNMSGSYFSQCFKQFAGQTYTDYVRDLRLERAKRYLRNTAKTIQWIAEQVGYNDEKYFSRLFREHVGMLPSEYRSSSDRGRDV